METPSKLLIRRARAYSQDGQLVYGWDTATNKKTDYISLNGSLIARSESVNGGAATTTYVHTDGLRSPVAETNAAGGVTQQTRYEPYGANLGSTATQGPGYTGHVTDVSTGLSYMQQQNNADQQLEKSK